MTRLAAGKKQILVTYGTSLTENGAWVDQVSRAIEKQFPGLLTCVNSGGSGKWSQWGVNNLERLVIQKNPDTVTIEFSANDSVARFKASVEIARANLNTMIDRILKHHPHCEIILLTMTPANQYPEGHRSYRENIAAHYEMYRSVARERNLLLIDLAPLWNQLQSENPELFRKYVPDTIHPTALGCEQITTPAILKALGLPAPDNNSAANPSDAPQ